MDKDKRLTNSAIFFGITLVSLLYWIVDRYHEYLSTYDLNDLLDGPLMVVSLVVVWVYSVGVWRGFSDNVSQLYGMKLGIALAWFSTFTWRMSRFLYAEGVFGKASIGVHDSWRGYMITLSILAGVLHIIIVNMTPDGRFSRRYLYIALSAILSGLAFVFLFKTFISRTTTFGWSSWLMDHSWFSW